MSFAFLLALMAPVDDWDKIGSRQVDFGGDRDTISGAGDGWFNAIKIDVDEGNLEMYNIKVTFGNGETWSPDTRVQFKDDTRSRTIDLPGEARQIKTIDFHYKSRLNRGKATVTVYGRRVKGGGGDWELLGSREVAFGGDKDTIVVTAKEGKFTSIKLDVEGGNLDLWNIKITFGDDTTHSPDTRVEFKQGSMSRTIDLPGEARFIQKVEFWYKSEIKRGKATIKLFGKQGAGGGGDNRNEKWEKLGSRQVDFGGDKDTIHVTATEGRFNAVRIEVEDGNLDLWNLKITFGDDTTHSPDTKIEFRQNSTTRVIDLPGDARFIKKIEFWYKSELRKGRATVNVFGRHASGGAAVVRKDPKDRFPGWEHLGTRQVDFGADKDTINCQGEGRFSSFKIEVEEGDLTMYDIVVVFGNGDKESPKTRLEFDDNTRSRDIDLPGKARNIKSITFYYKSNRGGREGKAVVHVYGKK